MIPVAPRTQGPEHDWNIQRKHAEQYLYCWTHGARREDCIRSDRFCALIRYTTTSHILNISFWYQLVDVNRITNLNYRAFSQLIGPPNKYLRRSPLVRSLLS
jgi:hypothetical protein